MANNRMFLVYRPTGMAVPIGKSMGNGWYLNSGDGPRPAQFAALFAHAEKAWRELRTAKLDDFALVMEDSDEQPINDGDWTYQLNEVDVPVPKGCVAMKPIAGKSQEAVVREINEHLEKVRQLRGLLETDLVEWGKSAEEDEVLNLADLFSKETMRLLKPMVKKELAAALKED